MIDTSREAFPVICLSFHFNSYFELLYEEVYCHCANSYIVTIATDVQIHWILIHWIQLDIGYIGY